MAILSSLYSMPSLSCVRHYFFSFILVFRVKDMLRRIYIVALICYFPTALWAKDPLSQIQAHLEDSLKSGKVDATIKPLVTSLSAKVTSLQESLGSFDKLPKSYQHNLAGFERRFRDISLDAPAQRDAAFLTEVDADFEDKLLYLQSGYFTTEIAQYKTPILQSSYQTQAKRLITFGSNNQIKGWSTKDRTDEWNFSPEGKRITSMATAKQNPLVIAGFSDGSAAILSASSGKLLNNFQVADSSSIKDVTVSPDGKQAVFALASGEVTSFDLNSRRVLWSQRPENANLLKLEFDPTGKKLASIAKSGSVSVVSSDTGKRLFDLGSETLPVAGLQFLPENNTIVTVGRNGALSTHNINTGKLTGTKEMGFPTWSVASSHDEKWLAAYGGSLKGSGYIKHARLEGATARTYVLPHSINSASFSDDPSTLFLTDDQGIIRSMNFAKAAEANAITEITVNVTTYKDMMKKDGYNIWYVAKALLDLEDEYNRFDHFSHATGKLPPGRYYLWAGTRMPNDEMIPLELLDSSSRDVEVPVP